MSTKRRPWRRCATCRGVCHWHDDAWVCDDCGDEYYEHDRASQWTSPGLVVVEIDRE